MGLPVCICPTGEHALPDGSVVAIRGLTRAEALQIREAVPNGMAAVEKLTVRFACEVSAEEAELWYAAAPNGAVEDLVNAIAKLSGLDPDEGKDDGGASLSANGTASTTSSPNSSANH